MERTTKAKFEIVADNWASFDEVVTFEELIDLAQTFTRDQDPELPVLALSFDINGNVRLEHNGQLIAVRLDT